MRPVAFSVPGKPSELGAFLVSAAVPLSIVALSLFRKFMELCGCIGFKIAGAELECRIFLLKIISDSALPVSTILALPISHKMCNIVFTKGECN